MSGNIITGGYNRAEREKQIRELLETELNKKSLENRKLFSTQINGIVKPITDVLKTSVEEMTEKTNKLHGDIKGIHTQCFTKLHLEIRDKIVRYQIKLGKIDVTGHPDLEEEHKRLTIELKHFVTLLESKTHKDGIPCQQCEVQSVRV